MSKGKQPVRVTTPPPPPPPPQTSRQGDDSSTRNRALAGPTRFEQSVSSHHSQTPSYSSTTQDDVVNNLLTSLDRLSRGNVGNYQRERALREAQLDRLMSQFGPTASPPRSSGGTAATRRRGNTGSSAVSSDWDGHSVDADSPVSPNVRGKRSNSSIFTPTAHHGGVGADRSKAVPRPNGLRRESTDTQKTAMQARRGYGGADGAHSRQDSDGSSTGEFSARSAAAKGRSRRSMSLNQLYETSDCHDLSMLDRGRPPAPNFATFDSAPYGSRDSSLATGSRNNTQGHKGSRERTSTIRKITTQSDLRSVHTHDSGPLVPPEVRDQASDFVRASSMRGVPSIPQMHDDGTTTPHHAPAAPATPGGRATPKEKPGFFKRVFGGGSRASSARSDRTTSFEYADLPAAPMDRRESGAGVGAASTPRNTAGTSTRDNVKDTQYPPVSLNKKSSSFFRRRRKSTSRSAPPPSLPLNASAAAGIRETVPSPSVSSLRKVMDPFLAEGRAKRNRAARNQRPPTEDSQTEESDGLDMFHSGYTPPPDASLGRRNPFSRSPTDQRPQQGFEYTESTPSRLKLKKRSKTDGTPHRRKGANDAGDVHNTVSEGPYDVSDADRERDGHKDTRPHSPASTGERIIAMSQSDHARDGSTDSGCVRPDTVPHPEVKSQRLALHPTRSDQDLQARPIATDADAGARAATARGAARSLSLPQDLSSTDRYTSDVTCSSSQRNDSNTSLPLPSVQVDGNDLNGDAREAIIDDGAEFRERARKIYDGDEEDVTQAEAASWLGETNTLSTRTLFEYMKLFDFAGRNILAALRTLCGKLLLRGETQQFDRILTALSERWCHCNPDHGFKAQDVVHTMLYSLILLNTDLHLADIGDKMSRSAYVKNTLPTIRRVVADAAPDAFEDATVRPSPHPSRPTLPWTNSATSVAQSRSDTEQTSQEPERRPPLSKRLSMVRPDPSRQNSDTLVMESSAVSGINALVKEPWTGSMKGWEAEIELMLKSFFASIRAEPLPLFSAPLQPDSSSAERNLSVSHPGGPKRSGSILSKTPSEVLSHRSKPGFRTMTMGLHSRYHRSRSKIYPASTMASSRTSFDDGGSVWSPVASSTLSKPSYSRTLTSASMQSLGHFSPKSSDYMHSIGFANALSHAIVREDSGEPGADNASISVPVGLLEDESLALEGAPWAKEGLVKHKHHLEVMGKKARERSWNDVFAVISKGTLTLFDFNTSAKSQSIGRKAMSKTSSSGRGGTSTVGGGDWMENAEQVDVFVLRQTIATTLPSPGYSKTRPHVWALSLPSGAVHLFQVGTPEIALEFMSTANYWSARLSKEPLAGSVSNIEYGWSDTIISPGLLDSRAAHPMAPPAPPQSPPPHHPARPPSALHTQQQLPHRRMHSSSIDSHHGRRPSLSSSVRGSLDTAGFGSSGASARASRTLADKALLAEWSPPTQSMMASQLMEVDQLRALEAYIASVESDLAKHNELKGAIEVAYTPRHGNFIRALANWRRKSDYLLREIVKFQTYADSLNGAQAAREAVAARKLAQQTEEREKEVGDSAAGGEAGPVELPVEP